MKNLGFILVLTLLTNLAPQMAFASNAGVGALNAASQIQTLKELKQGVAQAVSFLLGNQKQSFLRAKNVLPSGSTYREMAIKKMKDVDNKDSVAALLECCFRKLSEENPKFEQQYKMLRAQVTQLVGENKLRSEFLEKLPTMSEIKALAQGSNQ